MQKIVIKHFNQIPYAEIEIARFVCLIGEQASGKSTIAKIIYLFKSLKVDFLQLFFENTDSKADTLKSRFIDTIINRFIKSFGSIYHLDKDFELIYYFSCEENHSIRIYKTDKSLLKISFSKSYWKIFSNNLELLLRQLKNSRRPNYSSYLLQTRTNQAFIASVHRFVSELFHDDTDTFFFPAGRSILSSMKDKLLPVLQSDYLTDYQDSEPAVPKDKIMRRSIDTAIIREYLNYLQNLNNFFSTTEIGNLKCIPEIIHKKSSQILKGVYKNEYGKERIYYDDTHFVPLNLASSGQQDVIAIILDIFYLWSELPPSTRIIEEPETHLFPNAQRLLIELLCATMNGTRSSFIITTHSPFILAALNNLLYLNKALIESKGDSCMRLFGYEDNESEFTKLVPVSCQHVKAYNLNSGTENYCTSMIDESAGLIGKNLIDSASEDIYGIFDMIYDLL